MVVDAVADLIVNVIVSKDENEMLRLMRMLIICRRFTIGVTSCRMRNGIARVAGTGHGCDSSSVDDRAQRIGDVVTVWRSVIWLTGRLGQGGTSKIGFEWSVRRLVSGRRQ